MIPANRDDSVLHVHRLLDVDEDALLDAITEFAVKEDLELDRRHEGEGLLFRRGKSTTEHKHVFKQGDLLHVVITQHRDGHDVDFTADLSASVRRKAESRRAGAFRAGAWATGFAAAAAIGLSKGVSIGDFIWVLLAARSGRHVAQALGPPVEEIDELQRDVANALSKVCDDAEYGAEPDSDDD